MKAYPTGFSPATINIDPNVLSASGQAALQSLSEKSFGIELGLTRQRLPAIQVLSLQQSIKEYCPNDYSKRFLDEASAEAWVRKGRIAVLLVDASNGQLAGYGWVGKGTNQHIPEGETTFALRISEDYQGRGLATPYSQLIIDVATQIYGAAGLWLEAWQSNAGAVHIYEKLGFTPVASEEAERPTANGRTTTDVRLHMTYN